MESQSVKKATFIKFVERITKTDTNYVLKHGGWITFGNAVVSLLSLGVAIAFANFLPQETYGTYKFIIAGIGILTLSTLPELNVALSHAVARGNEGDLYKALQTKLAWGILGFIFGLIVAGYYFLQGNILLGYSFILVSLFLSPYGSFPIYKSYLNGKKLFKKNTIFKIFTQFIGSIAIISTIYITNNLLIILLIFLVVFTLIHIVIFFISTHQYPPNQKIEPNTISYGKQLTAIGLVGNISNYLDTFVVWYFLGAQQLAIYLFAKIPVDQIKSLLKFTTPLAVPKLAHKDAEELRKILPQKMILFSFFITLIVFFYILIAPYFYQLLFPKYTESVLYSQILVLSLIFFPKKLLGISLSIQKRKRVLWYMEIINATTKVTLLLILVPKFNVLGAVIAIIVGNIIHLLSLAFFTYVKRN